MRSALRGKTNIAALLVTAALCCSLCSLVSCDDDVTGSSDTYRAAAGQRDYRTLVKGEGNDTVTVMLYLCGSDLESEGGAATSDLEEIMAADIGDQVNIVVETGGARAWHNDFVDADANQRWQITDEGPVLLEDTAARDMSSGETLTDFISFSKEAFPADRYMLVLWDHGGGTVDGYAYDERFDSGQMMSLPELNEALSNADVVFDLIGFDCCLMGTAETAFMVEKYADYMVASQRVEPGEGWHYTPWIQAISDNTSISTDDLGRLIVDSYIEESRHGYYGDELTLSVTDLTYIADVFSTMYAFFSEAQVSLTSDSGFISVSQSLGQSRALTDNYDLVDLDHLVATMDGSSDLQAKLDLCIVYNGATIDDHNGLCLYFPYTDLSKVSSALDLYRRIGIDESYQDFIVTFANVMAGGQAYSGGGSAIPLVTEDQEEDSFLDFEWIDEPFIEENDSFYESNHYDGEDLLIDEKDEGYVLSLSDEDWELVTSIEQRVFLDDGTGYIDLGADSMYEFDDDGDLLIDFDNTWVALDGQLVCFYTMEETVSDDGSWFTYGAVPILMNDEEAEIIVRWDTETPQGYVAGWRYVAQGNASQKGLFAFENGMRFDFLCDFYTYDGEYESQYLWGEMTVDGPIEVSYEDVGDADALVYYELFDVYRNSYWTESVVYTMG